MSEEIKTFKITKIIKECPTMKTLFLDYDMAASPGQFVMVWLPGKNEKPMAVSYNGKPVGVTIQEVGECTKEMTKLKKGDYLGLRGPFGRGFSVDGVKNACIIGGGVGIPPLAVLAEELHRRNVKLTIILGGRSKDRIIFDKRLEKLGDLYITTDDGTKGTKGYTTDILQEILEKKKFDMIYTCGPELMMKKIVDLCTNKKIKGEASLERFMKCGFGVCGHCAIDDKLVCKDGPVFSFKEISKFKQFGKEAIIKKGLKVPLEEYHKWRGK